MTRFAIVDDEPGNRALLADWAKNHFDTDAELFDGPIPNYRELVGAVRARHVDVALVDFHMRADYSSTQGHELVASLMRDNIASVLVTGYSVADIPDLIWYKRYIPAVLKKSQLPEEMPNAVSKAIEFASGDVPPELRAYSTLVRVHDVDEEGLAVLVVPAISASPCISVRTDSLSKRLGKKVEKKMRFFASVNIGASSHDDVFIDSPVPLQPLAPDYAKLLRS